MSEIKYKTISEDPELYIQANPLQEEAFVHEKRKRNLESLFQKEVPLQAAPIKAESVSIKLEKSRLDEKTAHFAYRELQTEKTRSQPKITPIFKTENENTNADKIEKLSSEDLSHLAQEGSQILSAAKKLKKEAADLKEEDFKNEEAPLEACTVEAKEQPTDLKSLFQKAKNKVLSFFGKSQKEDNNKIVFKTSLLQNYMESLENRLSAALENGNYEEAGRLAMTLIALFKGLETSEKTRELSSILEKIEKTVKQQVATYSKVWKLAADVGIGVFKIGVGVAGIGCGVGGAVASGALGAVLKGAAGATTPLSGAGDGASGISNALFSPTEGKRTELSSRQQIEREEQNQLFSSKQSHHQQKTQTFSQQSEMEKAQRDAKRAIVNGS